LANKNQQLKRNKANKNRQLIENIWPNKPNKQSRNGVKQQQKKQKATTKKQNPNKFS
jgi:hypothetical protein